MLSGTLEDQLRAEVARLEQELDQAQRDIAAFSLALKDRRGEVARLADVVERLEPKAPSVDPFGQARRA